MVVASLIGTLSYSPPVPVADVRPVTVRQRATPCVPQKTAIQTVGGLGISVPRLPTAQRLDYSGSGHSQYSAKTSAKDVLGYYLPELAADCWKVVAINQSAATWQQGNTKLSMAISELALGTKSIVAYESNVVGTVLGEQVQLVQTAPDGSTFYPPSSGSTYSQPPSGSTYNQPYSGTGVIPPPSSGSEYPYNQPPSGYTSNQPPSATPTCAPEQITCPGSYSGNFCYSGTTCPKTTQPAPTCFSGQYSCNGQCVPDGSS